MSKLDTAAIKALAKQKIAAVPDGVRWTTLVNEIKSQHPDTPINTIWGSTNWLFHNDPEIVKVSKGIYAVQTGGNSSRASQASIVSNESAIAKPLAEKDFYKPFAEWLRDGLEEVTEALAIGGNIFKGKWSTPDVIGVLRPMRGDLVKFEPQIVSVEIKTDPAQPVVAFGQAISYRLFSHKSYLVLPDTTSADDLDRMIALSTTFGLGLVTFKVDADDPEFVVQVRATLATPDMVYVNQMATLLNNYDKKGFDRLF